jgi:hypothetical protein
MHAFSPTKKRKTNLGFEYRASPGWLKFDVLNAPIYFSDLRIWGPGSDSLHLICAEEIY